MDILKSLGDYFNFGNVPMQSAPSIVRADEDEEIFVQTDVPQMGTPSGPITHGPNGIFGDRYNLPTPQSIYPEYYSEGDLAAARATAQGGVDPTPVPMIPPEMNETIKDVLAVPEIDPELGSTPAEVPEPDSNPVPKPTGDLLADLKAWRATLEDGSADAMIADRQIADLEAGSPRETTSDQEERIRKGGSKSPSYKLGSEQKVPGLENQGNLTDDEREAVRTAVDLADAPTPDDLPAVEGAPAKPVKVSDPNGNPVPKEAAAKVAQEDPSGWEKAMSWVQRTFGINGQDLARFALLYAGSRLAGYDHQGSMSWSFQVAGEDLLDRRKIAASMADSGKYTPDSLEEYRKTGNISVLKPVAGKSKTKINFTSPSYKKGTAELVYKATDEAGNQYYVDGKGKPYYGDVWDGEADDTTDKVRTAVVGSNKSIINDITKVGSKEDPWYTGSAEADAQIAHDLFADYAAANGVPVDSAAVADVMRGAAIAAREQYRGRKGADVNSLQPFIEQQIIYRASNEAWAGGLRKEGGEMLSAEEFGQVQGTIMSVVSKMPGYEEAVAKNGHAAILSAVMEDLYNDYNALSTDEKKKYRNNFYNYLQVATLNPFD